MKPIKPFPLPFTFEQLTAKVKRIETTLNLENGFQLSIVTRKDLYGQLSTFASCGKVADGFVTFRMGKDFNRKLKISDTRCTSGNVKAQHAEFVNQIDTLAADALSYYASSEASGK